MSSRFLLEHQHRQLTQSQSNNDPGLNIYFFPAIIAMFACLLMATCVCCLRCVKERYRTTPEPTRIVVMTAMPYDEGVPRAVVNMMYTGRFDDKEHPDMEHTTCAICLQDYEPTDMIRKLPCGHYYHRTCIDEWCTRSVHCPVCRKDVLAMALSGDLGQDESPETK